MDCGAHDGKFYPSTHPTRKANSIEAEFSSYSQFRSVLKNFWRAIENPELFLFVSVWSLIESSYITNIRIVLVMRLKRVEIRRLYLSFQPKIKWILFTLKELWLLIRRTNYLQLIDEFSKLWTEIYYMKDVIFSLWILESSFSYSSIGQVKCTKNKILAYEHNTNNLNK